MDKTIENLVTSSYRSNLKHLELEWEVVHVHFRLWRSLRLIFNNNGQALPTTLIADIRKYAAEKRKAIRSKKSDLYKELLKLLVHKYGLNLGCVPYNLIWDKKSELFIFQMDDYQHFLDLFVDAALETPLPKESKKNGGGEFGTSGLSGDMKFLQKALQSKNRPKQSLLESHNLIIEDINHFLPPASPTPTPAEVRPIETRSKDRQMFRKIWLENQEISDLNARISANRGPRVKKDDRAPRRRKSAK